MIVDFFLNVYTSGTKRRLSGIRSVKGKAMKTPA